MALALVTRGYQFKFFSQRKEAPSERNTHNLYSNLGMQRCCLRWPTKRVAFSTLPSSFLAKLRLRSNGGYFIELNIRPGLKATYGARLVDRRKKSSGAVRSRRQNSRRARRP